VSEWLLEHFTLYRLLLFLCCAGWWTAGFLWLRPRGRELAASVMTAWVQFAAGLALDVPLAHLGFWRYREMPFTLWGVPPDLHLDWALIWGFGLVWGYRLLRRRWRSIEAAVLYLGTWCAGTVLFDALVYPHMLFLRPERRPEWWLADLLFLVAVLGLSLWVYHTAVYPPVSERVRVWSARVRGALYLGSIAVFIYGVLPAAVLALTQAGPVRPLLGLEDWRVLALFLAPPFLLGLWANREFADRGWGTALPMDPPLRLVTTGPYAYVRNPMQLSGLMLSALLVLYFPTWFMLAYVLDMAVGSTVLIALYEPPHLERSFGSDYERYRAHVRNWIPRLTPFSEPASGLGVQCHPGAEAERLNA
jgi:protein-S-isoprenylcysteine O-methyltransferase Ste14